MKKDSFKNFRITNKRTGLSVEIGSNNKNFILQEVTGISGLSSTISTYKNVFQDGESFKRQVMNDRRITITFIINNPKGKNEDLENLKKQIKNVLLPRDELQLLNLSNYYYVNCYIENTPEFNYNNTLSNIMLECTLYLRAFDPFWYFSGIITHPFFLVGNMLSYTIINEGVEAPYKIKINVLSDISEIIINWYNTSEDTEGVRTSSLFCSMTIDYSFISGDEIELSVTDAEVLCVKKSNSNDNEDVNLIDFLSTTSPFFLIPHISFDNKEGIEVGIITNPTITSTNKTIDAKMTISERLYDI